jgi:cytochrome c biogenesis protein CcmG/thiol:disulfide interchange protein DsbE
LITGGAVVAVIGVLVAIEVISGGADQSARREAPPLPDTVLVPPKVTLASLRGSPTAVNFWASWCEPCRKEAPVLERVSRRFRGRARVVGVDWSDRLDGARAFAERYGWTFPNLRDVDGSAGASYGLRGLPMTFIIDAQGKIARVLIGPQTESSLGEALLSALRQPK